MTAFVRQIVPAEQIIVVHAHLPKVEWQGTEAHVIDTATGLEYFKVQARKTFFDMVEHRQMFPSPSNRQCTSDLKRDPINKLIRRICRERGINRVVNCMGLRAEESTARERKPILKLDKRMSKAGRHVLVWLPIHSWSTEQVFRCIALCGQRPHWAYEAGMTRLSCCFCIMASRQDLTTAARLQPALYRHYVATEKRLGFTLSPSRKGLEEITGIAA